MIKIKTLNSDNFCNIDYCKIMCNKEYLFRRQIINESTIIINDNFTLGTTYLYYNNTFTIVDDMCDYLHENMKRQTIFCISFDNTECVLGDFYPKDNSYLSFSLTSPHLKAKRSIYNDKQIIFTSYLPLSIEHFYSNMNKSYNEIIQILLELHVILDIKNELNRNNDLRKWATDKFKTLLANVVNNKYLYNTMKSMPNINNLEILANIDKNKILQFIKHFDKSYGSVIELYNLITNLQVLFDKYYYGYKTTSICNHQLLFDNNLCIFDPKTLNECDNKNNLLDLIIGWYISTNSKDEKCFNKLFKIVTDDFNFKLYNTLFIYEPYKKVFCNNTYRYHHDKYHFCSMITKQNYEYIINGLMYFKNLADLNRGILPHRLLDKIIKLQPMINEIYCDKLNRNNLISVLISLFPHLIKHSIESNTNIIYKQTQTSIYTIFNSLKLTATEFELLIFVMNPLFHNLQIRNNNNFNNYLIDILSIKNQFPDKIKIQVQNYCKTYWINYKHCNLIS